MYHTRPIQDNRIMHVVDREYIVKPNGLQYIRWIPPTPQVPKISDIEETLSPAHNATLGSMVNGIFYDLEYVPTSPDPQRYVTSPVSLHDKYYVKDLVANIDAATYGEWSLTDPHQILQVAGETIAGTPPTQLKKSGLYQTELGKHRVLLNWHMGELFGKAPVLDFHNRKRFPKQYQSIEPYHWHGMAFLNLSEADIIIKLHLRYNEYVMAATPAVTET